jgi:beta-lactamase regulating signal transducer with metallopeptidase domain
MESLIAELNSFTSWLLIASLKSVPLIIAIVLVQHGFKKFLSASARHSLWLSVFICLSIPFGWELSFDNHVNNLLAQQESNLPALQHTITTPEPAQHHAPVTLPNSSEQISESPELEISIYSLISYLWASVFFCLSVITLWQIQRFTQIQKQATPANKGQEQLLVDCKRKCGLNKNIPLLYSSQIQSPLTCGLFKPAIILPTDIEQQLTTAQLSHVLLHELGHIQRRDILWNWLAYWVTLLHWFNPLVWYASRRMKADMEIACDAKVLTHLSQQDRNDYGLTLINVSQLSSKPPRLLHSLGILENHRELKNRLIMIKEFTTMTLKKSFVFGLIFSAFAVASLAQPETKTNTPASAPLSQKDNNMTLAEFARHAEKDLKTQILVGQDLANLPITVNITDKPLDYGQLLGQLKINGITAYKSSSYVQIVLARDARWLAIPTVEKGKKYFDDEYVTDSIKLEKACAGSALATLRPLVPQYGHLTAMDSANTLIISDFYNNIVRVKAMAKMLDDNTPEKVDCAERNISTKQAPTPEKK